MSFSNLGKFVYFKHHNSNIYIHNIFFLYFVSFLLITFKCARDQWYMYSKKERDKEVLRFKLVFLLKQKPLTLQYIKKDLKSSHVYV
jgi:hypothetical protein